jgi:hypothetical protein
VQRGTPCGHGRVRKATAIANRLNSRQAEPGARLEKGSVMVPRLVFFAAFFCALASRPETPTAKRRAPMAHHAPAIEAPAIRPSQPCVR